MTTYSKTILCLANSWKPGGRCVAGKVVTPQGFEEWVRPIGTGSGGAVSYADRQYEGGGDPALLDIITIQMSGPSPHAYQPENHQIDNNWYWGLVNKAPTTLLTQALDPIQSDLWGTSPFHSSGSGVNDRVLETEAPRFRYSLLLISVADLSIRVAVENPGFTNKIRVRGFFTYSQQRYALIVTDPTVEGLYTAKGKGTYQLGAAILCVSLGEPFKEYAYKLIAGVFLP